MMDGRKAVDWLIDKAMEVGVTDLATPVIWNEKFALWTGSGKSFQHHYGKGGLATHTKEVTMLALENNKMLGGQISPQDLYLSCLYHDFGKTYDYEPANPEMSEWKATNHKRSIYHISRSALFWNQIANSRKFPEDRTEAITHAILAHHGLREWGSPVCPNTKLAWMVHFCDGISARMHDADKWDHVKA